jgi:hypothetical protein
MNCGYAMCPGPFCVICNVRCKPERKNHFEDLGIDGTLEWTLMKQVGGSELDSSGSEHRLVLGTCKHVNEPLGFLKGEEFFD